MIDSNEHAKQMILNNSLDPCDDNDYYESLHFLLNTGALWDSDIPLVVRNGALHLVEEGILYDTDDM